ncbi:MAG: hypothetical protein HZB40_15460 [Rhodocyclales bacterium]|nr:hypothetical protein [Rhodocyclales bacterium]
MIFEVFSDEALRLCANLDQRHDAWTAAVRNLDALPSSMYWVTKDGRDYLTVKPRAGDHGKSQGARSSETEARFTAYQAQRAAARAALAETKAALLDTIRSYRGHRLPMAAYRPAAILRELDVQGLLGNDLLVVGTNAFAAYEIEAGARFSAGIADETDDFDLSWCRGSRVSLSTASDRPLGSSLMRVLKAVDASFAINKGRPYQALDRSGYEVELLVAPSIFRTLPENEVFEPLPVSQEQEWLLQGRVVRHVVVSRDLKSCPICAPDPRWMALHKLWLAAKPERKATKRPKDRKQGEALLDLVRERMPISYPLDVDFVLDLPDELRPLFDAWAASRGFMPGKADGSLLR